MSVSDLTNTTWEWNDGDISNLESYGVVTTKNINFTSNNETFTSMSFLTQHGGDYNDIRYNNTIIWWSDIDGGTGDFNTDYAIFTVTGGADVTDSQLIEWIEENATQQIEPSSNISIGSLPISKAFFGTSEVQSIWYGTTKVYEKSGGGGYTVNLTLDWPDNIGDDYADKSIYVSEGDVSSQFPTLPTYYYDLTQDPNTTTTGSFTANGTITIWYTGSLGAEIMQATLNGSPITFSMYDFSLWYCVLDITQDSTLYIKCYGYD